MRRRRLQALFYSLPLLCTLVLLVLGATTWGSYGVSWRFLQSFLHWLEPGFYYPDPQLISMYHVTQVCRKLAHIVLYGLVTGAAVYLSQWGKPRLLPRSVVIALLLAVLFMGLDTGVRLQSGGIRHVRTEQFILNGAGVGIVLLLIFAFFGIKALERRWFMLMEESDASLTAGSLDPAAEPTTPAAAAAPPTTRG